MSLKAKKLRPRKLRPSNQKKNSDKNLRKKKKREALLFKNTLLKRRLLTSRRKLESQRKTRRLVLNRLRDKRTELRPSPTALRMLNSIPLLKVRILNSLDSKVEKTITSQERPEAVAVAEVAAAAEVALLAEEEAVPKVPRDNKEVVNNSDWMTKLSQLCHEQHKIKST